MPVVFEVTFEAKQALSMLATVTSDKWPAILANAANETGYYVLNKYRQQMPQYLDSPTPYTLNSMFLKKATPKNVNATVQWKDSSASAISAGKYLQPEVYGGPRSPKRFERALQAAGLMPNGFVAVPTDKAPRDSYGNVPGSFIVQILSYLRANPSYQQNRSVAKLRRMSTASLIGGIASAALNRDKLAAKEAKQRARGAKFFTVIKGQGNNPLPSGIYQREDSFGFGFASRATRIFTFVPVASYKVSFPFGQIGTDAANSKFPSKLADAIAASKAKG